MAKLDPTSPGPSNSSYLPRRVKASRPPRPLSGNGHTSSFNAPFDYNNCPSPTTSGSLSPPPTAAALSFDQFAPVGGIDPFAPNMVVPLTDATNAAISMMGGDLYQSSLPFDEDIVQSMQSMSDPNVWQDISLPGKPLNFHLRYIFFIKKNWFLRIRLDGAISTKPWHRHE
jgi:hypothetical protein